MKNLKLMKRLILLSLSLSTLFFTSCKDEALKEKTKVVDTNKETEIDNSNDVNVNTVTSKEVAENTASNRVVTSNKIVSTSSATAIKKVVSETELLRQKHAKFLENSPFKKTMALTKSERKALGITPNKYYESEWELTMDPALGRPTPEKLAILRKKLEKENQDILASGRVPGDASDNNWVERGPTNVGGRVRAIMFDPNDATTETVFAGGVSGGLWKNTNISTPSSVWTRVNIPENLAVSCITYDPNNTNIFYVGTGESYVGGDVNGDGVWKSTNAGLTWTKVFGGISGPSNFQSSSVISVNSPAGIAGNYVSVETTAFGTSITGPITANLVLVNDGSSSPTSLGCNALTNSGDLNGKIALIRRGSCNFIQKIENAQNAGAIAVIMINNVPGTPLPMGGTDTGGVILIPSVMISKTDGDLIEANLASTVNVTLMPSNGGITGLVVPGKQHINDIKIRNNGGVSEVYVAAGDAFYSAANSTTYLGGPEFGLYKSTDGGSSWSELNLPLTVGAHKHCPNDIAIGSDNEIFVSTTKSVVYGDGGGMVFSSTDGVIFNEKFTVPGGDRTQIAVSRTTANKAYILAEVGTGVQMYRTTDDFATYASLPLPDDADTGIAPTDFTRGQAFYDLMLEVDPNNDQVVYTGGIDLFKSTNGGTSWNQFSHWYGGFGYQEVHADQHTMAFANGSSTKMAFGNDGGVYFSSNSGTSTTSRNSGLNITQFYTVGVAPTTNGMTGENFLGGAQDNGSQMLLNAPVGAGTSTEVQGGDGAHVFFDQNTVGTDRYRITNYVYNQSINLYNYATSATRTINSESTNYGAFICPMALDSALDILYSDYSDTGATTPVYRIRRYINLKSGTVTKTSLTNALLTASPTALTVSKYTTATTTLLVGTRNGKLLRLTNANTTPVWADITGPDFVGSVSDVEYGASNNEILVTMHNYNVVSIWYSADGGTTWVNKEGNLPDLPVKCIVRNPLNTNEVVIGTELGVWYTNTFSNASPTWLQAYNGMRNVKVTDLDVRNDNKLYAATYGRGIFSGMFTNTTLSTVDNFSQQVSIFPNPTNGVVKINIPNYTSEVTFNVYDLNGREVLKQNVTNFNLESSIDLSKFAKGFYILNIKGDNLEYSKKIVLE